MPGTQRCSLCGLAFDPAGQNCRPSCPLGGGCGIVCCPRCGHGAPQEDRGLAGMIKKALVRLGRTR